MEDIIICPIVDYKVVEFDPTIDKEEVTQNGFIDLAAAYVNHSVPSDMYSNEESYNGIEDPKSILGKPSDAFDVAQMKQTISDYKAPSNNPDGV